MESAIIRLICGIVGHDIDGCDWYEGIEFDALEELRNAANNS